MANPYDLSTWRASVPGPHLPPEPAQDVAAEPDAPVSLDDAPDPCQRDEPGAADEPGVGEESGVGEEPDAREEPPAYDPVELPTPTDPFELARRTVNRSRAAARDRGLFPISAKTQARDVRDRSTSAPGYSGARPDPRDPQGVQLVLRRVLGDLGWTAGMSAGRVLEEWDDIVGERIAAHCSPVSFEDGVLVVSASSSAWASQMRMITPQLITTIEEHIGSHVVSELRVTGPAAAQRTWKKGRRTVTWRGPRDTYG
ncbi:DUF721 domain-containing protein [Brachybacterium muris]|uniref:DUF721 domain-containing protein n=1 Tax=Brachybacterium muris TaxID=219301 RepID=UPI00223BE334|nr:DciA family protein [Brachybacterium muris]